jgi:hypothetical protein
MTVIASERKKDKLAAPLTWLANKHARAARKTVVTNVAPRNPTSVLQLTDGPVSVPHHRPVAVGRRYRDRREPLGIESCLCGLGLVGMVTLRGRRRYRICCHPAAGNSRFRIQRTTRLTIRQATESHRTGPLRPVFCCLTQARRAALARLSLTIGNISQ